MMKRFGLALLTAVVLVSCASSDDEPQPQYPRRGGGGAPMRHPAVQEGLLGLYKAMAGAGPVSSRQVAEKTGADERMVREWLRNQAAGGYVVYDEASDRYTLPAEHALALADEDSPFYILGVYDSIASLYADEDKILEAFRSGKGLGWHEHDHRLFRGTERFFRPGYRGNLVSEWIPALQGVQEKLERGAKVADIGCGHGASTVIMAEAFPNSEFFGFDYHDASIKRARELAQEAGVEGRASFAVASAKDYPGSDPSIDELFGAHWLARALVGHDVRGIDTRGFALMDEYRIYLRPYVLGSGAPFFTGPRPPLRLVSTDLVGADTVRVVYAAAD